MTELEFIESLVQLPLTVLLMIVVFMLWRELKSLQVKYEKVLIDMGELRGKVDSEIKIEQKLEQIFSLLEAKKQ